MIKKKKITYISDISEENRNNGDESKLKSFKEKFKQCQKDKEEYLTQAQRARADLINYRKRQEEKIIPGIVAIGQVSLIHNLVLPVLDSLESGAKKSEDIKQIKDQISDILIKNKIKEIEAIGERFNPEFHEAVELVESKEKSGIVVEEVQKGYTFDNKVLRPSKVKISK